MFTPLLLATEVLIQQSLSDSTSRPGQLQDAVLVLHQGVDAVGDLTASVTTPIGGATGQPWTLAELRDAVRLSDRAATCLANSFTIDRTIGGRPKNAKDQSGAGDGAEGGIAGAPQPSEFDLVFRVSSNSVIPGSIIGQFEDAVAAVEAYFESQIYNAVTVEVRLSYIQLAPNRLGVTTCRYGVKNVADVFNAIDDFAANDGDDVQSTPAATTLPIRYSGVNIAATPENRVYVTQALQKALGLYQSPGIGAIYQDGVITLNNSIQWDFDPSDGLQAGPTFLYSFQDSLIREVMQLFGMVAGADFLTRDCTVMDFFRFQRDIIADSLTLFAPTDFAPPVPCAAMASASLTALEAGTHVQGPAPGDRHALDYNPGLNKTTIARAAAAVPPITPEALCAAAGAPLPDLLLIFQMRGLLDGDGNPMTAVQGNAFDDARLPLDEPTEVTVYPDGATQTVASFHAGAHCAFVDFRKKEYTIGGLATEVSFLGAIPRLVARDSPANGSIMNYLIDTDRNLSDFEITMYDGSPVRGCFIIQNELAELSTRCLMGKSITKGVTWYSRDPLAVPPYSVPLGTLPDFLTHREWLILDSMGWKINRFGDQAIDATAD